MKTVSEVVITHCHY